MNEKRQSSHRVHPTKNDAAATRIETERQGVQSHTSNYNCFGHGYAPEQLERGKRTLRCAEQWRSDNQHAWACIVSHALDLAAKGQPIAAQALIESVRKKAFVDRFGNDTKTNNSFASVFARWLSLEHPEIAHLIERRRSVFDVLIGGHDGR